MITTKHDFEVIWRIKLSDDFFYFLKTDIVEDKYQKLSEVDMNFLFVALGGALGAVARYAISLIPVDTVSFSEWLTDLRKAILEDTLEKIEKEGHK